MHLFLWPKPLPAQELVIIVICCSSRFMLHLRLCYASGT